MVALPLFKLGSLLLRHVSKYGANYIKAQAHDHPKFRAIAARYGQTMHQVNMRFTVSAMRDVAAERRAKEKAEAPTVKTEAQMRADEEKKQAKANRPTQRSSSFLSIWKRKFRPLPEEKAVDLFADVIGDTFILSIAIGLIMYEYIKGRQKPDLNALKIEELEDRLRKEEDRIAELEEVERKREERLSILEQALQALEKPKGKSKLKSTV